MAYDYDKLDSLDGRKDFNELMKTIKCSHLELGDFLVGNIFEDKMG